MYIEYVVIEGFKRIKRLETPLAENVNIIVGNNETGKTSFLEAIQLCLKGQINRRPAVYEIHPFIFNQGIVREYIEKLKEGVKTSPPHILVELYFDDDAEIAKYKGKQNSLRRDKPGMRLMIHLDEDFHEEFEEYISDAERIKHLPAEYYTVTWLDFAGNPVNPKKPKVRSTLVDPSTLPDTSATSRYILELMRDLLDKQQSANVSIAYRMMRDKFLQDDKVSDINQKLSEKASPISNKTITIGLDLSSRGNWEGDVQPHLDGIPISLAGKGEQNIVKIKSALHSATETKVILIEEPENHLSHSNLNSLVHDIRQNTNLTQVIISTHSSFVINKLGLTKTLMLGGEKVTSLDDLPASTREYFIKLPGHDTLRMLLAKRVILVEGPSDELLIQRAYFDVHGKMPLENQVEVISVNALAFKRFLDIAARLDIQSAVVTDNDGDEEKMQERYSEYSGYDNIEVLVSDEAGGKTLEPQVVNVNSLDKLNGILGTSCSDKESLADYMEKNKSASALSIFESQTCIEYPKYISEAINE